MRSYQFLFLIGVLSLILAELRDSLLPAVGGIVLAIAGMWVLAKGKEA